MSVNYILNLFNDHPDLVPIFERALQHEMAAKPGKNTLCMLCSKPAIGVCSCHGNSYCDEHMKGHTVMSEEGYQQYAKYYLSWEWNDVLFHPSKLNSLVLQGLISVNYKSHSSTNYKLCDPDTVSQAIEV